MDRLIHFWLRIRENFSKLDREVEVSTWKMEVYNIVNYLSITQIV
jgi:hypothetical protein